MRVIRPGMIGEDIKAWEYFLRGRGYYWLEVDGKFDSESVSATKHFQSENKLVDDGVVGKLTYSAAMKLGFDPLEDDHDGKDGPNWPPRPDFKPLAGNDARAAVFGQFKFRPAGIEGNPEAVQVLDDWYSKNIVTVEVPQLRGVKGTGNLKKFAFHRLAAPQIVAFFQAVEDAGLAHLVLTWGGSYSARFIRGSRSVLSNHCLPAQETVWTPEGPVPIGDMGGYSGQVWTYEHGRAVTRPVREFFKNGKKRLLKVEANGHVLRCTPNHPVLVLRKKTLPISEWRMKVDGIGKTQAEYWTEMVRAEDLRLGDRVVCVRQLPNERRGLSVDGDWAETLGLFIGDGCVHHRYGTPEYLSFSIPEEDRVRSHAIDVLTRCFGRPPKEVTGGMQLAYYHKEAVRRFAHCDKKAPEKRIPEEVWSWDAQSQVRFLLGLLYSDGTVISHRSGSGDGRSAAYSWKFASQWLAEDLKMLLASLGFRTRRITSSPPTRKVVNGVPWNGVGYWQTGGVDVMGVLSPDADPLYAERVKASVAHRQMDTRCWGYEEMLPDFTHHAIRKISEDGESEVFDIEVGVTHNFLSGGVVVSNSFGSAFDINVPWNYLGSQPALVGKHGSVRELVPIANEHGLYWGGHFGGSRPDGMHFEVAKLIGVVAKGST